MMRSISSFWIFDWRKVLAYSHRWLGIAGCVLFVAWFISGVVMMYARMPGLADEERLARAPALDLFTGDVVLRTTRAERFWGYLGPVFHWVYLTPLRRNGYVWSEFIIWSSLIGCVMCLTGIVWGLWRFSPRKRFRLKRISTVSPYAGWMKWHHISGLLFGVVTLTWTYSGLLSMGPFNWFRSAPPSRAEREASTGGPLKVELLTIESMKAAVTVIEPSFPPKELESMQFRGEPFWAARRAPTEEQAALWMYEGLLPRAPRPRLEHRYVSAVHPERGPVTSFGTEAMNEIAHAAMPGVAVRDAVWLQEYDGYYYDSRGSRPLPVLRVRYQDEHATWLYLDPQRGGIVQRSSSVSRLRRWLYQGLHSFDFPFLYFHRPLWDLVVIVLSVGGTVLSFTTMLPAWRRLKRHARTLAAWRPRRVAAPRPIVERADSQS
jgi:hypothetical protein